MPHHAFDEQANAEERAMGRKRFYAIITALCVISVGAFVVAGLAILQWKHADDGRRRDRLAALHRTDRAICISQKDLTRKTRDFYLALLRQQQAQLPILAYYQQHPDELALAERSVAKAKTKTEQTFNPATACEKPKAVEQ